MCYGRNGGLFKWANFPCSDDIMLVKCRGHLDEDGWFSIHIEGARNLDIFRDGKRFPYLPDYMPLKWSRVVEHTDGLRSSCESSGVFTHSEMRTITEGSLRISSLQA